MLIVTMALFSLGLYGILTRRDIIGILASVEVMLGAAFVLLAGLGAGGAEPQRIEAASLVLLVMAACEAAVGLALLVSVVRSRRVVRLDELDEVRD